MSDDKKTPWQVPNHHKPRDAKPSPWAKPEPKHDHEDQFREHRDEGRDFSEYGGNAHKLRPRKSRLKRFIMFIGLLFGLYIASRFFFPDVSMTDNPYALRNMFFVLVVGGFMAYYSRSSTRRLLKFTSVWLVIVSVLSISYVSFFDTSNSFNSVPRTTMIEKGGILEIDRARDGHFWVVANINGTELPMMVDTGASMVVLSKKDAKNVGLSLDSLAFNGRSSTANGTVSFATTRVSEFAIGSARFNNFVVSVNGGEMDGSLLGMDAINQFSSFEISGDTLRLTP